MMTETLQSSTAVVRAVFSTPDTAPCTTRGYWAMGSCTMLAAAAITLVMGRATAIPARTDGT